MVGPVMRGGLDCAGGITTGGVATAGGDDTDGGFRNENIEAQLK
jgi:hypothetical protein